MTEAGYQPYESHPLREDDHPIPHKPLHSLIRTIMEKGRDESMTDEQREMLVSAFAIHLIFRVELGPDALGLVPIIALGRAGAREPLRPYWQLAYPTAVPGLYLRDCVGVFDDWEVVTGRGFQICSVLSRQHGERLVKAIAEAVPELDWREVTIEDVSDSDKENIREAIKATAGAELEPLPASQKGTSDE